MISALLLADGCSSSRSATTSPTSASQKSTVRITYTVTSRPSATEHATITYTDPLDGSEASVAGDPGWIYTWLQVPANKPIALQVRVTGPYPASDSCAIRIDIHQVTGQKGHSGAAPGAAVTCTYRLTHRTPSSGALLSGVGGMESPSAWRSLPYHDFSRVTRRR
jgi:hypothetical protein